MTAITGGSPDREDGASGATGGGDAEGANAVPDRVDRALTRAGAAAVVVSFGSILLSTLLAPWFSWTGNALSELGAPAEPYSWLFNWGLILGGVLGSIFVARVALESESAVGWLGSLVLLWATGSLAAIGAFPVGHPLHAPAAVSFFVALTYGLVVDGSAEVLAGRSRAGLAGVWLGMGNATGWLAWGLVAAGGAAPGVALPEFVGAVAFAAWVVPATRRVRGRPGDREPGTAAPESGEPGAGDPGAGEDDGG